MEQVGNSGIQTAGLAFGGTPPNFLAICEEYNGSSWAESGDLSTPRATIAGFGIQTATVAAGGNDT